MVGSVEGVDVAVDFDIQYTFSVKRSPLIFRGFTDAENVGWASW